MVTSSKRTYATHGASQVCYSQSPCSHTRPLLTHASAGDTQTLKVKSGSVSVGIWVLVYTQGFVWVLWALLVGMGFYFKCVFYWRRQWQPTPVLLPRKSPGWRSLVGCSPWNREELDMTELLHFHFSLSCIGEGNGNPLKRLSSSTNAVKRDYCKEIMNFKLYQ